MVSDSSFIQLLQLVISVDHAHTQLLVAWTRMSAEDIETGRGEFPVDDITESDEGLLDSDKEEVKGQGGDTYPDVGELDYDENYDELIKTEGNGNNDEVKVHVSEDIEEGEVTSDEEGEIKESDDDHTPKKGNKRPSAATPTSAGPPTDPEASTVSTNTGKTAVDKGSVESKPSRKKSEREGGSSSEEGSVPSSDGKGRGEGRDGDRSKGGGENVEKLPTVCRHFLGGKCNWGNNCRFLHEEPKDRPKLPHSPMGGHMEFRGGPRNGPWGMPRGFPPPHFLHGPMGPPHDLPPHMDPLGPMPLHPPGRGGFRMPPMGPFGHMHARDMPPGRPFDPMSPRGMDEQRSFNPRYGGGGSRPGKKSGKVSEVAEETDGWMRLRTVTADWSSDEEPAQGDLRDKIKSKRSRDSDSDSDKPRPLRRADDWTDPWARDIKKDRLGKKKRKKSSSSEEASDSEEEEREKSKKSKNKKSSGGRKGRKKSESSEESSDDERSKKKKKKKEKKKKATPSSQSSLESEDEVEKKKKHKEGGKKKKKSRDSDSSDAEEARKRRKKGKQSHHLGSPSPPGDPRRYGMRDNYPYPSHPYPSHLPPDDRHRWPPHPHHPHSPHPFDFPHTPPHTHDHHSPPKKDQFGRDISKRLKYQDSQRARRGERHAPSLYHDDYLPPPHHPGQRDLGMWDPRRVPHPFVGGHGRRRRSSEDGSRSPTPIAGPESDLSGEEGGRGRHKKHKRSRSRDSEKSITRREKILRQELEVIDKAIAKRKSKKRY